MHETLVRRVHAAALAGWWTLLVAVILLWVQWGIYLWEMNGRPAWVIAMLGTGVSWEYLQSLWLIFSTVFKMIIWVLALVVVWMTLWERQMRKAGD